ncbi:DUF6705 family protein [Nonlabens ulvanivorans]|uniref:DUF6705 family protein n=1 Tax=Nonlabens ulvanivorans TaxID=906888 RepID=UPI00294374C6|nr:DUF6705 family protein [Nonlabens ulvanivorans]WOI22312.1 DUF6705 family protein [Nonlabens ulvanivorans]
MKNYINILLLLVPLTFLYGQSPIYPIYNNGVNLPDDYTNVYFKDLNNDLDKYVGTWIWEENGNKLTVVLQKSVMHNMFDRYQEDILVGNYKYEENGVVIIDTMTNPAPLTGVSDDEFFIDLWGDNKSPDLIAISGFLVDPIRSYAGYHLECTYTPPSLSPIGSTVPVEPAQMRWVIIPYGFLGIDSWDLTETIDRTLPITSRVPLDLMMVKQ